MSEPLPVRWVPREPPLPAVAAVVTGDAALRHVARLRADEMRPWAGLGGPGWLVLVGGNLPWADGIRYLGRDPAAPRLLLPTHSAPEAAGARVVGLVERWVLARVGGRVGPYAVVPDLGVIPLGAARPVDDEGLRAWAAP